jgi:hypothetical protein
MMKVRGLVSPRVVSGARMAALAAGDIDELLRINRAEFGGHVMMADEPDEDDDDADDDGDDSGDADKKGTKKSKDSDSDADADDDGDDDDDSAAEREKLRKRIKAADRRASEAERKVRELEDADKSEAEKATARVTELEKENGDLQSEVSTLRLQNAFLTANKQKWHDPDVALDLARSKKFLEDVVDEDGEVDKKALGKALERLAKEHPYLVMTDDKSDKDDEPGEPSGQPAGGRSDNVKDEKAKKAQLRQRFPVLNR